VFKGKVPLLLLAVMLLPSCFMLCSATETAATDSSRTITVPDDFSTIQSAIAHAKAGDTVFVKSGTYDLSEGVRGRAVEGRLMLYTALTIDKPISLIGESCSDTIILEMLPQGTGGVSRGIIVESDNVLISGFNIKSNVAALVLSGDNITLTNTVVNSTFVSVVTDGRVTILSNVLEGGSKYGIIVDGCGATISNNLIQNFNVGIAVRRTAGNYSIVDNKIVNNSIGVGLSTPPALFYHNNLINCTNTVFLGTLDAHDCSGTSENVNATLNYWGTTNQSVIENSIYDYKNDSSLGTVNFTPFLTSPDSASPIPEVPF
jgi:hypothetical protein